MNEELQILLGLMNDEGNAAQVLSRGLGDGNNQGSQVQTMSQQAHLSTPQAGGEVEITDDMRAKANGVVNKARRGGNGIQGVTNFLQQPAVQEALINFGQSIANSGNWTGQPNPVNQIGDFGKDMIRSTADQKALEAFERGEDPAQAGGQFANPELVTQLQGRQQQQEQFEEEIELRQEQSELRRDQFEADSVIQTARLAMDQSLAESRITNLETQAEIDQQMADARQNYWEAIADQEGEGRSENLTLRTNEYLEVLSEQRANLNDSISTTLDALDDLEVSISDQQLEQLKNGVITTSDIDVSDADVSNWPGFLDQRGEEARNLAKNLLNQLGTNIKAFQTSQAQENALKQRQTERLTGEGEEEIEQRRQSQLFGSRENPIPVGSPAEMKEQEPGTFVNYGGIIYEIGPNNTKREVSQ